MHENGIRFLHIGDTHFGVHYALKPKNPYRRAYGELFFQKLEEVINKAVTEHQVDFIIHTGDFFNRSKPPPEVVDRGVKPFQLAAKRGIPIFIIPGNHERSKLPLGLLPFSDTNINLFSEPCSYIFKKKEITVKLTGFPYIRHKIRQRFLNTLSKAWKNSESKKSLKPDYSILVTHQLIDGSRIEKYTFRNGHDVVSFHQIPKKINYVACGHVHRFQFLYNHGYSAIKSTNKLFCIEQDNIKQRWQFNGKNGFKSSRFHNPIIAYAGSLERVSIAEKNEPKGYIIGEVQLTEMGSKINNVTYQFHELNAIKMEYLVWDLSKATIDDYVTLTLKKMYSIYSSKKGEKSLGLTAIFKVKIQGEKYDSSKNLEYLKQEAKRLNIYLTFSYNFTPA